MAMIERSDTGAVARLTLNAPERMNALSDAMLAALMAELETLAGQDHIRAVIIAGAGKAFCAGHDLNEMTLGRAAADDGQAYFADLFGRCAAVMMAIRALPQPVIAEVHGVAAAAGCQLVASCDMAVAAEGTRFGVNDVNIGLFCSTPMVALSRAVPRKQAFEMLTTGAFVNADRACEIGLINRAVAPDALQSATMELAQTVADKLGGAVRIGKRAFYEQLEMGVEQAYLHTGDVMTQNMMMAETAEGIEAFLSKRSPNWSQ
ncbi:Enoyl-CoA hydratase/carnithine racemase [Roseovarius nanhaiticus]|uniref:Enoyl-CoA hydratase domain-containing protein 3, mitochondrial n=1 Tax=Roseovarius nanhaiticus TaxID=573024 RepID=A0A1N7HIQ2_9RHOB|nr:enoyl-CoA hydratase [Roseovarius nanhaiticus]SEK92791.1 Enoyl-CoA hydratase/carnithine racemase [Roseovarius nanhaiticus]SIS24548.1 Enoyl-CoA hydratase/carnithine racemase [Roseovarius nanhaiticus]